MPAGARTVFASGQLGMDPEGEIPPGIREQAKICFENAKAILAEAGMALEEDVVRVNAFVTNPIYLAAYMEVRDSYLGGGARLPASTLMVVSAFAHPTFKVEIEVVAAKARGGASGTDAADGSADGREGAADWAPGGGKGVSWVGRRQEE